MKKTQNTKGQPISDNMRAEYEFDYSKARPNRFAGRIDKDCAVVMLEPDISKVFTTSDKIIPKL